MVVDYKWPSQSRYAASPKGKVASARYRASQKCKDTKAAYNNTVKRKAYRSAYNASPEGKAAISAYNSSLGAKAIRTVYSASDKGRANNIRNQARRRSCLKACITTFTSGEWEDIKKAQHGRCNDCGTFCTLTIDHVIPLGRGGHHTKENIQGLCKSCNCRKGDRIALDLWK